MKRIPLFIKKTLYECSTPKILVAFLVPYFGLTALFALGFTSNVRDDLGSTSLFTQEQVLIEIYSQLSFMWLVSFPMVLVGILAAITIAGESEKGTYQLLLSKPIHRWEPIVGKFIAIVIFGTLTILSGLFIGALLVYLFSGASSAALGGSIGSLLFGTLIYGFIVTVFVATVGTLFAVFTGSRLKTALGTAILPVLFFAFIFVRVLPVSDLYEDYFLYLLDLNYHLGHLFVFIQEAVGTELNPATQQSFTIVSGVYDIGSTVEDPLLDGIVGAVPLAGHVPTAISVLLIAMLSIVVFAGAVFKFQRMDIS